MTEARKEQQKYRSLAAIVMTIALVSCGPLQSGKWYDSESDVPPRPMAGKPKPEKKEEVAAREPVAYRKYGRACATHWIAALKRKSRKMRRARAATQKTASGLLVVQKGDTYYSLSQTHKVPLRALLEANKARPPYVLSLGDRVTLPTQAFYEVKKKDTLYSISRSHKTDVATLAKLNGLKKPFTISVGQRLQILCKSSSAEAASGGGASSATGCQTYENAICAEACRAFSCAGERRDYFQLRAERWRIA